MQTPTARDEAIDNLRILLRDLFAASERGVPQTRLARAHGYTDGFMKALIATGIASQRDLLTVVAEERERYSGPALRVLGEIRLSDPRSV